ncbi:MAG TPA: ABC transporter permease subunit [Geminicoccus sp.]|uniref:ABC transporter permease n=1 Tax=Geminicoccus sp. TaxID=2024832 RepID=UPI002E2EABCC|nr:ABC transporter permease subunit [Geminicoccus sp.]HEX2527919.1 ABC transporter permease subunit [Geminicoccus sp.]
MAVTTAHDLTLGDSRAAAPPRKDKRDWLPFFLSFPTLLVVFLVIGLPLIYSLALSLHRINMLTRKWIFVGLGNYTSIIPQPDFIAALMRTASFAVITVVAGLVLGMGMALVLNMRFPGRALMRSVVLIPWAMAPVTVGVLWGWIFDGSYGPLNGLLLDLGLSNTAIPWLGNGTTAFGIVALVHVWNQAPLTALLILAGLQSMPDNLHRAALIDGAGPFTRFFKITVPWLRPMLLLIMILTTINSIMAFDLFWTMTKGGPGSATTVFSWMGYAYAFQFMRMGEGAAILYVLTILCLVLAWFYLKLFFPTSAGTKALVAAGTTEPSDPSDLKHAVLQGVRHTRSKLARLPAFTPRATFSPRVRRILGTIGMWTVIILIFVWSFVPFAWLVIMSLQGSADLVRQPATVVPGPLTLENFRYVLFPDTATGGQSSVQASRVPFGIWNSFVVAVAVTVVNLILGGLAGYAYARSGRSRLMGSTLWALMLTRMTPSLALILPFFLVFKTLGLLDTRTGLVIAYCSLILPLSTWMMKGYFEGLPPNLEKAALVDGCSRMKAIWKIVLPVSLPGLVAAGIFCFLVSWNEFIFALILTGTPNAQTIPVIIAGFLVQLRFYDYGPMFAASVLAVIPPVVIALLFQRWLVSGMLSGSIKG